MQWLRGIWVAGMVLLACAHVRADGPTSEPPAVPSLMDPDPLSPRAVAEAAQDPGALASVDEPDEDETWRQQRHAENLISAGAGLGLSGLAHIAVLGASGLHRCENGVTIRGSMVAAGLVAALGTVLVGVGTADYRAVHKQRTDAPKRTNNAAVPIGLATFVGVQAALWGVWFAGAASNGNCYFF